MRSEIEGLRARTRVQEAKASADEAAAVGVAAATAAAEAATAAASRRAGRLGEEALAARRAATAERQARSASRALSTRTMFLVILTSRYWAQAALAAEAEAQVERAAIAALEEAEAEAATQHSRSLAEAASAGRALREEEEELRRRLCIAGVREAAAVEERRFTAMQLGTARARADRRAAEAARSGDLRRREDADAVAAHRSLQSELEGLRTRVAQREENVAALRAREAAADAASAMAQRALVTLRKQLWEERSALMREAAEGREIAARGVGDLRRAEADARIAEAATPSLQATLEQRQSRSGATDAQGAVSEGEDAASRPSACPRAAESTSAGVGDGNGGGRGTSCGSGAAAGGGAGSSDQGGERVAGDEGSLVDAALSALSEAAVANASRRLRSFEAWRAGEELRRLEAILGEEEALANAASRSDALEQELNDLRRRAAQAAETERAERRWEEGAMRAAERAASADVARELGGDAIPFAPLKGDAAAETETEGVPIVSWDHSHWRARAVQLGPGSFGFVTSTAGGLAPGGETEAQARDDGKGGGAGTVAGGASHSLVSTVGAPLSQRRSAVARGNPRCSPPPAHVDRNSALAAASALAACAHFPAARTLIPGAPCDAAQASRQPLSAAAATRVRRQPSPPAGGSRSSTRAGTAR